MIRSLTLPASLRPGRSLLVLAALCLGLNLAACSSDPPPDMAAVKKMVAEDRNFEALTALIPMATAGDPQAQYELAGFYHYGYVGPNDYAKALRWYRASARQGYADSMVGLAVMYLGGQGVAKDRREAFVWLNLAAQYMSDQKALAKVKKQRDEIGRTLTKDDIAFAKAESLLLQPDGASVQPNEAESIDHLPDFLPPAEPAATVGADPLQNVPPDTGPLSTLPLTTVPQTNVPLTQSPATPAAATAVPAAPLPATTTPATTTPVSSAPSLPSMELQPSLPAAPRPAPVTTLPATTTPASTVPAVATPAAPELPTSTLPATTAPTTPDPLLPPPITTDAAPLPAAEPVDPVPAF
jgi:hypothetical protein